MSALHSTLSAADLLGLFAHFTNVSRAWWWVD